MEISNGGTRVKLAMSLTEALEFQASLAKAIASAMKVKVGTFSCPVLVEAGQEAPRGITHYPGSINISVNGG